MTFGTTAHLEFNLGDRKVNTIDKAIKAINDIMYMGGATATTAALTLVKKQVVKKAGRHSDRVMIFITDGQSNMGDPPKKIAQELHKEDHFEVYAIGEINCHYIRFDFNLDIESKRKSPKKKLSIAFLKSENVINRNILDVQ